MTNRWIPTIDVAELAGKDVRTVKKLAEDRGILSRKGRKNSFLWPCPEIFEAIFALPDRKGYEYERERLTKAQADKTELEAEVLRGTLVPREVVEETVGRMVTAARARLLSIPVKTAAVAVSMSESEIEHLVTTQIHEALLELATGRLGVMAPTTETDGQPVGGRESKTQPRGKRRTGPVE